MTPTSRSCWPCCRPCWTRSPPCWVRARAGCCSTPPTPAPPPTTTSPSSPPSTSPTPPSSTPWACPSRRSRWGWVVRGCRWVCRWWGHPTRITWPSPWPRSWRGGLGGGCRPARWRRGKRWTEGWCSGMKISSSSGEPHSPKDWPQVGYMCAWGGGGWRGVMDGEVLSWVNELKISLFFFLFFFRNGVNEAVGWGVDGEVWAGLMSWKFLFLWRRGGGGGGAGMDGEVLSWDNELKISFFRMGGGGDGGGGGMDWRSVELG